MKPTNTMRNAKLSMQNPDYWFVQGYDYFHRNLLLDALDSYRKALTLDNEHLNSINNMACVYEQ